MDWKRARGKILPLHITSITKKKEKKGEEKDKRSVPEEKKKSGRSPLLGYRKGRKKGGERRALPPEAEGEPSAATSIRRGNRPLISFDQREKEKNL